MIHFRMMVMRMDSRTPSVASLETLDLEDHGHIDQLQEPPIAQRMGIMAAFMSFDDFAEYVL